MAAVIDKFQLADLMVDPHVKVVDARPTAAFNGWKLSGESRGGHIPGALAFPASWAEQAADPGLKTMLVSKKLTPGHKIVLYGDGAAASGADTELLARRLADIGYHDVATYEGGFPEWAADDRAEVASLPRYDKLVHRQWLHDLLSGRRVPAQPAGEFVLCHVNYGVPAEYEESHIPGAIHLDTNTLESAKDWNRRPPRDLRLALLELGIAHDTTVIVYGRNSVADPSEQKPGRKAGQIAATRAAAILMYAGVRDVRLLDGGYNAWIAAGLPVETVDRKPTPATDFGVTIPANPAFLIDLAEVQELLAADDGVVVSIRSFPEYLGDTSGYNYISETGDIPGTVWGNCGTNAYDMQYYRNVDNTMKDYEEIAAVWQEIGITPDKRVVFYCGTGWRASETLLCAYLMGWPRVAVYDGGWFEWSRVVGVPDRRPYQGL